MHRLTQSLLALGAMLEVLGSTALNLAQTAQSVAVENVDLRVALAEARLRVIPARYVEVLHVALTEHVYALALDGSPEAAAKSDQADAALMWLRAAYVAPRPNQPMPRSYVADRKAVH